MSTDDFHTFNLQAQMRLLPEFAKVSNLPSLYITDAFRLLSALSNALSKLFSWLVLNRSRKNCLALQWIRMVVSSTAFFRKSMFVFEIY